MAKLELKDENKPLTVGALNDLLNHKQDIFEFNNETEDVNPNDGSPEIAS